MSAAKRYPYPSLTVRGHAFAQAGNPDFAVVQRVADSKAEALDVRWYRWQDGKRIPSPVNDGLCKMHVEDFANASPSFVRTLLDPMPSPVRPLETVNVAPVVTFHIQFRAPGSPWAWLTRNGSGSMNPSSAYGFSDQEDAKRRAAKMMGPTSSIETRVVSRKH